MSETRFGEHTFATFIRFITAGGGSVEECSSERKETAMKYVEKTLRPRLPRELAEKLRHGSGGGRHHDKKADFKRQPKHRNNTEEVL